VKLLDADKTRMIGLPYGEQTMTICWTIFILYRNVTDRQMDRIPHVLWKAVPGSGTCIREGPLTKLWMCPLWHSP